MGTFDWSSLAMAGVQGGAGLFEGWRNREFQRDVNKKNEELMREAWGREDTAAQRRAADLEAAGLSKTLAAGGAASSMPAIKLEPLKSNAGQVFQGAIAAADRMEQISMTKAQKRLVDEQANTQKQIGRKAKADADVATIDAATKKFVSGMNEDLTGQREAISMSTGQVVPALNYYQLRALQAEAAAWKEAELTAREKQFMAEHADELERVKYRLMKAGATEAEAKAKCAEVALELAKKDLKWYTATKVLGAVGSVVNSAKTGLMAKYLW